MEEYEKILRKIKDECDIVSTNPPFSKFKTFMGWMEGKDFIVIGNKNAMLWKTIFPRYFYKELYFGYNYISKFRLPDDTFNWFQGSGRWFTTFPTPKENPTMRLTEYDPERHKRYDTYNAINTDSIKDVPDLKDIEIGVPIGIIDYINPEQFEITGMLCRGAGDIDKAKPIIDGKHLYTRVLIQRK